ncbi:hypothetical protein L1856_28115 [Streptomyces sp. Tue 6430]|nr:hypothetical protein [Streptomyces sp. Tue 6430]
MEELRAALGGPRVAADQDIRSRLGMALVLDVEYDRRGDPAALAAALRELETARAEIGDHTGSGTAQDVYRKLADAYRRRGGPGDTERALEATERLLERVAEDVLLQIGAEHGLEAARAAADRGSPPPSGRRRTATPPPRCASSRRAARSSCARSGPRRACRNNWRRTARRTSPPSGARPPARVWTPVGTPVGTPPARTPTPSSPAPCGAGPCGRCAPPGSRPGPDGRRCPTRRRPPGSTPWCTCSSDRATDPAGRWWYGPDWRRSRWS